MSTKKETQEIKKTAEMNISQFHAIYLVHLMKSIISKEPS